MMNKTKLCYPVISFIILLTLIPIQDVLKAQSHSPAEPVDHLYFPSGEQVRDLRQQFLEVTNDTLRMSISWDLAYYYLVIDPDSSRYFSETQMELARALNQPMWEADALMILTFTWFVLGNYTASLRLNSEALTLLQDEGIERGVWKPERLSRGAPPESARLALLALAWHTGGPVYGHIGNVDEQQARYRKAFTIAEQIGAYGPAYNSYANLGYTYMDSQPDSALFYLGLALEKGGNTGFNRYSGSWLYNIGIIHMNNGDYETASQYYREAIRVSLNQNNVATLGNSWYHMAELHIRTGETGSAIESARKSFEIAESADNQRLLARVSSLLSSLYKDQNNFEQAYLYMEKALAIAEYLQEGEQIRQANNLQFADQLRLRDLEEAQARSQARIRMIVLLGILFTIVLAAFLLYRNYRQQQGANTVLQKTLADLKTTQSQLVQQEKLASLGQLTAGIAHEIKNPLNFVNNFSDVSLEMIDEALEELGKTSQDDHTAETAVILADIKSNLAKINEHGTRADGIVQSMLMHSRGGEGKMEPTDLNALVKEYVNLSFHGMRAGKEAINVDIDLQLDETIGDVPLIAEDFSRVILNLCTNGFDACAERSRSAMQGAGHTAQGSGGYEPKLTVRTRSENGSVIIEIEDNGPGIPDDIKNKILQPFFTTKKGTQGTGLGLSITNDIVKAHGGDITIASKPGEGSVFSVNLPLKS